jgi:hypothetical protein
MWDIERKRLDHEKRTFVIINCGSSHSFCSDFLLGTDVLAGRGRKGNEDICESTAIPGERDYET